MLQRSRTSCELLRVSREEFRQCGSPRRSLVSSATGFGPGSTADPQRECEMNVIEMLSLREVRRTVNEASPERFVFASSDAPQGGKPRQRLRTRPPLCYYKTAWGAERPTVACAMFNSWRWPGKTGPSLDTEAAEIFEGKIRRLSKSVLGL